MNVLVLSFNASSTSSSRGIARPNATKPPQNRNRSEPHSSRFADSVAIDKNGELVLTVAGEEIRQHRPVLPRLCTRVNRAGPVLICVATARVQSSLRVTNRE